MKKDPNQPAAAAELRRRAEERLQTRQQTPQSAIRNPQSPIPNPQSTPQIVHELEVHQIELEMQNEELQRARASAEALLAQYTDLYEFAPTGYYNLAADGTILAVNLTGARLLGLDRAQLLKRRFTLLVSQADRPVLNACLAKTFAGESRECCEVALLRAGQEPLFVRVEAVVSAGRLECRAAVLDVADRHRAEVEQARLVKELQTSLAQVKLLSGLLPICAHCKKIRDDQGYWKQVEGYISSHSEATFSHGICPECLHKLYPEQEQSVLDAIERKETQNAGPTA